MQMLTFVQNVDWVRLWWIVGIVAAFWTGLVTLLPPKVYQPVAVVLAALQAGLLFAARGGKYVADRTQLPPADGKV